MDIKLVGLFRRRPAVNFVDPIGFVRAFAKMTCEGARRIAERIGKAIRRASHATPSIALHTCGLSQGVTLVHFIGWTDGLGATNPWIRKHIFPGGYMPALSDVPPAVEQAERAGAIVTDIEILRLCYAMTLRVWRRRFLAQYEEAKPLYDGTFCRMWEFYLACCAGAFRFDNLMVFQMRPARSVDTVPRMRCSMSAPGEPGGLAR